MRRFFFITALIASAAGIGLAFAHNHAAPLPDQAAVATAQDGASRPDPAATPLKIGGAFTLVDQDGKTITNRDFSGKYMMIFFGFTYCPDICPTEIQTTLDALKLIDPQQAAQIQPIFITVDPKRDTPAVLKAYVQQFSDHLIGLTGSEAQIATVARAYKVYYNKQNGSSHNDHDGEDYMMDHSSFTYLMGKDGEFIKVFAAGAEIDAMAADLKSLIKP